MKFIYATKPHDFKNLTEIDKGYFRFLFSQFDEKI